MKAIKIEFPPKTETARYDLCRLCLSTDRQTHGIEPLSYVYSLVTDWASRVDVRVCWECRAVLERIHKFRLQAAEALQIFKSAQSQDCIANNTLTRLCQETITTYDAEFIYNIEDLHIDKLLKDTKNDMKHNAKGIGADYIYEENFENNSLIPPAIADEIKSNLSSSRMNTTSKNKAVKTKSKGSNKNILIPIKSIKLTAEKFKATEEQLSSYREAALLKLKMYKCLRCIIGFPAQDDLDAHNESFHSEAAGGLICDVCGSRFRTEKSLVSHRNSHSTLYRCKYPSCNFVHAHRTVVRSHFAIHRQIKEALKKKYIKNKCKNKTADIEHEQLLKRISAKYDSYECNECGKSFKLRRQIIAHVNRHMLSKSVCDLCGRIFANAFNLKRHMLAHLDPSLRRHDCNICKKIFTSKYRLLIHARLHTGERPFKCDNCEMAYTCKNDLQRHRELRHSLSGGAKKCFITKQTKPFRINKNQFLCVEASQTHACSKCDRKFKYPSQLKAHFKVVHEGLKLHPCTFCNGRFSSKSLLNKHLNSHSNKRPYKCDQCDLTFKYDSGLWMHKLIHKGEKPHQCTICGSKFTLKSNLVGHMKTHTKEKPFQCNICERKFPWKRNLKNHLKTHVNNIS